MKEWMKPETEVLPLWPYRAHMGSRGFEMRDRSPAEKLLSWKKEMCWWGGARGPPYIHMHTWTELDLKNISSDTILSEWTLTHQIHYNTHTCTYTHMHTHKHTPTHTHTRTQTHTFSRTLFVAELVNLWTPSSVQHTHTERVQNTTKFWLKIFWVWFFWVWGLVFNFI